MQKLAILMALLLVPASLATTLNYVLHRNINGTQIILTDDYGNSDVIETNTTTNPGDKVFLLILNETTEQSLCGSVFTDCKPNLFVQPPVCEVQCQECPNCPQCPTEDKSVENNCVAELGKANTALKEANTDFAKKKDYTGIILILISLGSAGGMFYYIKSMKQEKPDPVFTNFVTPKPMEPQIIQPKIEQVKEEPKQPHIDLEAEMRKAKNDTEEQKRRLGEIQNHLDDVGLKRDFVQEDMEDLFKEMKEYERKHRIHLAEELGKGGNKDG